jgi:hypothetical protein
MGKLIKCPACGDRITVAGTPTVARAPASPQKAAPAIYISTGKIVGLISLAVLIGLGMMFYFGPVRVWHQWEDVGSKAKDDVSDVITFGLQAYLSQQGMYDPGLDAHGPSVDGNVSFFRPTMVMSMPEKVRFFGKSSQGDFQGWYHPSSGEIEADVNYGGMTFAGAVTMAKATGTFHMTGRMLNGFPQAEINGTPLKMVTPDHSQQ